MEEKKSKRRLKKKKTPLIILSYTSFHLSKEDQERRREKKKENKNKEEKIKEEEKKKHSIYFPILTFTSIYLFPLPSQHLSTCCAPLRHTCLSPVVLSAPRSGSARRLLKIGSSSPPIDSPFSLLTTLSRGDPRGG